MATPPQDSLLGAVDTDQMGSVKREQNHTETHLNAAK